MDRKAGNISTHHAIDGISHGPWHDRNGRPIANNVDDLL